MPAMPATPLLCMTGHFHVADRGGAPCPTCGQPPAHRLDAPEAAWPGTVPTGEFDERVVRDARGHPFRLRTERVAPRLDAGWVPCTEPTWAFLPPDRGRPFRFEAHRLTRDQMRAVRASVCNPWTDSEDYGRNRPAQPFLQGFDEAGGWLLVEFAVPAAADCQAVVDHLAGLVDSPAAPTPSRGPRP